MLQIIAKKIVNKKEVVNDLIKNKVKSLSLHNKLINIQKNKEIVIDKKTISVTNVNSDIFFIMN
jgi:hypothetical protein